RRRVRREDRFGGARVLERREDCALGAELLEHGLDDDVAARELGGVGDEAETRECVLARVRLELPFLHLAREEVRDAVACGPGTLRVDFEGDRVETRLDR